MWVYNTSSHESMRVTTNQNAHKSTLFLSDDDKTIIFE